MDSILYQLYQGQILPAEQFRHKIPLHKRRREECCRRHNGTLERLKATDRSMYDEIIALLDEQLELDMMEIPEIFCEGFSIGVQMMVEVFTRI